MSFDPKAEEVYQIKGDPKHGMSSTMNLTKTALGRPFVRYKDRISEADVYEMQGQLMVHMFCPRCGNTLRITSDRKRIDYDREANLLSVEPFECTWELDTDSRRMEFGLGLCRWRVAIDRNIAKDV